MPILYIMLLKGLWGGNKILNAEAVKPNDG
jgi:hypothetical protein